MLKVGGRNRKERHLKPGASIRLASPGAVAARHKQRRICGRWANAPHLVRVGKSLCLRNEEGHEAEAERREGQEKEGPHQRANQTTHPQQSVALVHRWTELWGGVGVANSVFIEN